MIAPTAILFFLYALRDAAREGNLVKVRDLVNDGALVSANNLVDRYSPLHAAANQGHLQVVDYLVSTAHANVHATEKYEESTPLHEACQRGHLAVAKYLIEQAHADAYYKDKRLRNALHKSAAAGHLPVVQYLVSQTAGALVNDRDQDFKTPLHEACMAGHLPVVMFLVQQARARVHDISITGDTALHYAIQYGHVQVAKFLWQDAKARLDVRNGDGKTPVDCARMAITYANEHEMQPLLQQWTTGAEAASPNNNNELVVPQQPPSPPQNVAIPKTPAPSPEATNGESLTPRDYKPEDLMVNSNVHQPSGSIDAFNGLRPPAQPAMNPNRPRAQSPLPRHETPQLTVNDKIAGVTGATPGFGMNYPEMPPPPATVSKAEPKPEPVVQPPPPVTVGNKPAVAVPTNGESESTMAQPASAATAVPAQSSAPASWTATPPPAVPQAERAETVAQQSQALPVKTRLDSLEKEVFMSIQKGKTLERVAALELILLGQTNAGTISARLSTLEKSRVEIGQIVALEQELAINPFQQGSLLERMEALELELWGASSAGPLAARLLKLEEQAADLDRIVRLEQELEINPGQQGSRLDRIASLEEALLGETYVGTTFLSRLVRLEAELLG